MEKKLLFYTSGNKEKVEKNVIISSISPSQNLALNNLTWVFGNFTIFLVPGKVQIPGVQKYEPSRFWWLCDFFFNHIFKVD